jgi:hypothetical protein
MLVGGLCEGSHGGFQIACLGEINRNDLKGVYLGHYFLTFLYASTKIGGLKA